MTSLVASGASEDLAELLRCGELDRAILQLRSDPARTAADARTLAWLEQRRGEFETSVRTLDAVLAGDARDVEARSLWASGQWLAGNLQAAETALAEVAALESGPEATIERAREDLVSLREERSALVDVRAAERRLDGWFIACVVLVSVLVLVAACRASRHFSPS